MTDPIQYDYTRGTERSGWGVVGFDFIDKDRVQVRAFGLKPHIPDKPLEDFYFLAGEELIISLPDGTALYEIIKISYGLEPYDLFTAELKYIQHLTGFKIAGQWDKKKHERSLEWGKRLSMNASNNKGGT